MRDILLQVGLAAKAFKCSGNHDMMNLLINRLELFSSFHDILLIKRIRVLIADLKKMVPEKVRMSCSNIKMGSGLVIFFACYEIFDLKIKELYQWVSDAAGTLETLPLVMAALGEIIRGTDKANIKIHAGPMFSRLLLRSSLTALKILNGMCKAGSQSAMILELGDAFWVQFTSETDDNRRQAQTIASVCFEASTFIDKLDAAYSTGKSLKVKKSICESLYGILKESKTILSHEHTATLLNLLGKEMNEDLTYWIACCLAKLNPNALVDAYNKQSKTSPKLTLLAALSLGEIRPELREVNEIISKKSSSNMALLLSVIYLAQSDIISLDILQSGLKANGFLFQSFVAEALAKYPLLPTYRLASLFAQLSIDFECCRNLWRSLLSTGQYHELTLFVAKLSQVSTLSLSSVCLDILSDFEFNQATPLCKLIYASIKSQEDLLNFLPSIFSDALCKMHLWKRLSTKSLKNPEVVNGIDVIERLKTCSGAIFTRALEVISFTFPQCMPTLRDQCVSALQSALSKCPTEDDLVIFNTPDKKELPAVDGNNFIFSSSSPYFLVISSSSRKLPLPQDNFKKDSPRTTNFHNQSGLGKAERQLLDTETRREIFLKRELLTLKKEIEWLAEIIQVISKSHPSAFEPYIGEFGALIAPSVTTEWLATEASKLFYAISQSCHIPNFYRGPLLITTFLSITGGYQYISRDWNIRIPLDAVSALCHHLTSGKIYSKSSFYFSLPIILQIFQRSRDIEITEFDTLQLMEHLQSNVIHFDLATLKNLLESLAALVSYLPGTIGRCISLVKQALEGKVLDDTNILIPLISSKSPFVRQLGLSTAKGVMDQDPQVVFPSLLFVWIKILNQDPLCSELSNDISFSIIEQKKPDWKSILDVALSENLDGQLVSFAISALCKVDVDESFYSYLEGKYKSLYQARIPEMVNIRSKNLDLTASARIILSLIYLSFSKTQNYSEQCIPTVIKFILHVALFDQQEEIRSNLLDTCGFLIENLREKSILDATVSIVDQILSKNLTPNDDASERVRVYAVIIMSKLASHFDSSDLRRLSLLSLLSANLSTPSEVVQKAVADSLASLIKNAGHATINQYLSKFMDEIITGKSIAIRRGSAYGLAALVKGSGSCSLKKFSILEKLVAVLQEKSIALESKQGALFGIELIAFYLGRCFEPYIIDLLDVLIIIFSDGRAEIKEAATDAANVMMNNVSSPGAQLILPIILSLLETNSWRSKVGALEWLGAMAHLSPRVLSKQLPNILPKILDALTDSHHAVQKASRDALYRYSCAVRNPEIKSLAPLILDALANPPQSTQKCLNAILNSTFAHVIDGPSMALIESVLVRALKDRATGGAEIKKKATQILGNLATNLIDPRDLALFLHDIVPALLGCLSDPVPEVRANCGKVLGILVRAVDESSSPVMRKLQPDLFNIISAPYATSVDRAGAAQALAEVFASLGSTNVSNILKEKVLSSLQSSKVHLREGFVMLVGFLPAAFDMTGNLAELYEDGLRDLLGPSIALLADDNESVREAASSACYSIIARIAKIDRIAVFDILLETLSDSRWRCRLGCLQLLQEFLSKFAAGESDISMGIFALPSYHDLVEGGIDAERICQLMAKCFLYRFDENSSAIRHLALSIWKSLADHPLRTLATILPILTEQCCTIIHSERQGHFIAAKAIEDVLVKVGDRIIITLLENLVELLERQYYPTQVMFIAAQVATIFGGESFPSPISSTLTEKVLKVLITLLQQGLFSPNEDTREMACKLFIRLNESASKLGIGSVVENVTGPILEELVTDPTIDPLSLNALSALLSFDESGKVFECSIERVLEAWSIVDDNNLACSLCSITSMLFERVGANGASKSVSVLKSIMMGCKVYSKLDNETVLEAIRSILASLEADEDSPYQVSLSQFLETLYSDNQKERCYKIIKGYCMVENADLRRFYNVWPIRIFAEITNSQEARDAMNALLNSVDPRDLSNLGSSIYSGLLKAPLLPESCKLTVALIVKNIIVPMLLSSNLLATDDEERRSIACRLSCVLAEKVTLSGWSTSLTPLIGSLIRAASDKRMTGQHVFKALSDCTIAQVSLLKPFHPQLQRIFLNALCVKDTNDVALDALVSLAPSLSRPEQLFSELLNMAEGERNGRLAALRTLEKSGLVCDIERCVAVAKTCLTDEDKDIRCVSVKWVTNLLLRPEFEKYKESLQSLLPLI